MNLIVSTIDSQGNLTMDSVENLAKHLPNPNEKFRYFKRDPKSIEELMCYSEKSILLIKPPVKPFYLDCAILGGIDSAYFSTAPSTQICLIFIGILLVLKSNKLIILDPYSQPLSQKSITDLNIDVFPPYW